MWLVEEWGVERFRQEVAAAMGVPELRREVSNEQLSSASLRALLVA